MMIKVINSLRFQPTKFILGTPCLICFLFNGNYCYAKAGPTHDNKRNQIVISGSFPDSSPTGKMHILLWENVLTEFNTQYSPHVEITVPIVKGHFKAILHPKTKAAFMSLGWQVLGSSRADEIIQLFPVMTNDNVNISLYQDSISSTELQDTGFRDTVGNPIMRYKLKFSGMGSVKYTCLNAIKDQWNRLFQEWTKVRHPEQDTLKADAYFNIPLIVRFARREEAYYLKGELATLRSYKDQLSTDDYNLIRLYVLAASQSRIDGQLEVQTEGLKQNQKTAPLIQFIKSYLDTSDKVRKAGFKNLSNSFQYVDDVRKRLYIEHNVYGTPIFELIRDRLKSSLRERVTMATLFASSHLPDSTLIKLSAEQDAYVTSYENRKVLQDYFNNHLKHGIVDFALPDSSGHNIHLSDFKGKVVFVDFYYVGCSHCADYYEEIVSKVEKQYEQNPNIIFIAIALDTDRERWIKSGIGSNIYTTDKAPNVVNVHTLLGYKDPLLTKLSVHSFPHPLLVDKAGKMITDSEYALRGQGIPGLVDQINKALAQSQN